jgi:hypothetical protein
MKRHLGDSVSYFATVRIRDAVYNNTNYTVWTSEYDNHKIASIKRAITETVRNGVLLAIINLAQERINENA